MVIVSQLFLPLLRCKVGGEWSLRTDNVFYDSRGHDGNFVCI